VRIKVDFIPWPADRLRNDPWTAGPTPKCRTCGNDTMVVVAVDPVSGTDQAAPCPDCRLGFMVEFGYEGEESRRTGETTFYQDTWRMYWGDRGYWADHSEMRPETETEMSEEPLTPGERAEHARRTRVLAKAISTPGGFHANPHLLEELYEGDPKGLARDYRFRGIKLP
jgi:hypothetical protein